MLRGFEGIVMTLVGNKNVKTQAVFMAALALLLCMNASTQAGAAKSAPETEEKTQSMEIMLEAPKAAMADPAADRIRDTLKAELKAFRKHDIEAAYSYASDKARTKYKTPKQFFRVMKNTCGPLSDHLSYSFLDRSRVGDAIFQKMQFVGANRIPTKGVFRLIQDENGLWRTDSCIMFETDAPAV